MEQQIYHVRFPELGRIRVIINDDGKPVVPIVDIADVFKYSRQAIRQICIRNQDALKEFMDNVTLSVKKGRGGKYSMENICLTRDGVIAVLFKIIPSRVKNQQKRDMIINFQKWAIRTLGEVIDGKIPSSLYPIEIEELLYIKNGRKLAAAVRKLAEIKGCHRATIYRQRAQVFGPMFHTSRKGFHSRPDEVQKILNYKEQHPEAGGKRIKRTLNLQYSLTRINRILKENLN